MTFVLRFPDPIDMERRDEIVEILANRIQQFGLTVPAVFFLEMNKPLSYLGGQALHFFAPVASILFSTFEDYAYFLDDRGNVELLIQKLEAMALVEEDERRAEKARKQAEKLQKKSGKTMLDEAIKMDEDKENPEQTQKKQ